MDIWFVYSLGLLAKTAALILVGHVSWYKPVCVLVHMSTCFLLGGPGGEIMASCSVFTAALSAQRECWLSSASVGSLLSVLPLYPLDCL